MMITVNIAEIRIQVWEAARGRCEFPRCRRLAVELAHLHSRGMGGRRSGDGFWKCIAACYDHARITDGLTPNGPDGQARYRAAIIDLTGKEPGPGTAYLVAEVLLAHIIRARGR